MLQTVVAKIFHQIKGFYFSTRFSIFTIQFNLITIFDLTEITTVIQFETTRWQNPFLGFFNQEGLHILYYSSSESPSEEYPPLLPLVELRFTRLLFWLLWFILTRPLLPQSWVLLLLGIVGLERCAEVRVELAEPVAPKLEFLVLKGATELCL